MTLKNDVPVHYDRFFALGEAAFKRHGMILEVPVRSAPLEYLRHLYRTEYPQGRVLDFGCGARKPMQSMLGLNDALYHSCDNDPSGVFTYRRIEDIVPDARYDIVAANQVFEHLSFQDGIKAAVRLGRHVALGGVFQIGVPNPQHPTRYLSNPTHQTPWNYLNLCALLEMAGLEVILCARANKYPKPKWWEMPWVNMMCRVFRIDWCDTVYAVGRLTARMTEPAIQ